MPLMLRRRSYKQTLFEDFDGAANSAPNAAYWNNLEDDNDYPAQAAKLLARNAYLDGNSNLVIRAVRESDVSGASYTSGQISTVGKFEQAGGRFEFRAQMPAGGSGSLVYRWRPKTHPYECERSQQSDVGNAGYVCGRFCRRPYWNGVPAVHAGGLRARL